MESELMKKIQIETVQACPDVRLFRNNVGQAWTGQSTRTGDVMTIRNPRPLNAGLCVGSSDLIGFTSIEITPDMVGAKIAVFTAIEVKTVKGTARKEQAQFINTVKKFGGFAGIVRTTQEAIKLCSTTKPKGL
jgi:hypothetical protein